MSDQLLRDDSYIPIQGVAQQGAVALSSPPAQTNVGADTALTFAQQVHYLEIQNNTGAVIYWELDAAAQVGAAQLAAGATLFLSNACAVLHLYTAAAQNVNGASANNIVIRGWL